MTSPQEYISLWYVGKSASGKTEIYHVRSNSSEFENSLLGTIKWFARWRRYAFFPAEGTIWDSACLQIVKDKLWSLNKTHYAKKEKA